MRYPTLALTFAIAACSGGAPDETTTQDTASAAPAVESAATQAPAATATPTDPAATPTATVTPAATASATPASAPKTEAAPAASAKTETVAVAAAVQPKSFLRCAACHTVDKGGENKLGPNLWGVTGKPAGVHSGFAYSPALTEAGITWTDANLDAWLENPRKLVPGNRMSFPGIKDPAMRKELIDYLKALR